MRGKIRSVYIRNLLLGIFVCIGTAHAETPAATHKAATGVSDQIGGKTGANTVPPSSKSSYKVPPGDPCSILPFSVLQKVFPGIKAGVRMSEEYGVSGCEWRDTDGVPIFQVDQEYSTQTALEKLRDNGGFADPLKPGSIKNVRFESFPGIGVDAAGLVEKVDARRGILVDRAVIDLAKGDHHIALASVVLAQRERADALKVLQELGRVAAKRLQP